MTLSTSTSLHFRGEILYVLLHHNYLTALVTLQIKTFALNKQRVPTNNVSDPLILDIPIIQHLCVNVPVNHYTHI